MDPKKPDNKGAQLEKNIDELFDMDNREDAEEEDADDENE
jgi:hypothetical protein